MYHVFYTAYNEDFKLRGKTIQSVMQATGKNLENLETVKDFCLSQMENSMKSLTGETLLFFGMTKTNAIICCWLKSDEREISGVDALHCVSPKI